MIRGFYPVGRILTAAACLAVTAAAVEPEATKVSQTRRLMGVAWTITVCVADVEAARLPLEAAFAEVARLEAILSDYDPTSEVSRLSARAPTSDPVPVSPDLWRLLDRAARLRDATAGAFDPTVGPLVTLWRRARRSETMPPADKLAAARAAVGIDTLRLDRDRRGVMLTRPGMRLDFGGIGMGYAVDRALDVLAAHGVSAALVDASGDVGVSAAPPAEPGWRIAIRSLVPGAAASPPLVLTHAAVTTSGDAFQGVEIDGIRYSHIVDPRSGLGVVGPSAVTVIAPDCTTADALATAASVLGPDAGSRAIAEHEGVAARFEWRAADGTVATRVTPGWPGGP